MECIIIITYNYYYSLLRGAGRILKIILLRGPRWGRRLYIIYIIYFNIYIFIYNIYIYLL